MAIASGFDNELYFARQAAVIAERVSRFHNKLYLEFGGAGVQKPARAARLESER